MISNEANLADAIRDLCELANFITDVGDLDRGPYILAKFNGDAYTLDITRGKPSYKGHDIYAMSVSLCRQDMEYSDQLLYGDDAELYEYECDLTADYVDHCADKWAKEIINHFAQR